MEECQRCEFDPWVRKILWRRKQYPHSSILAWIKPETEEPGRLQSMGSQTVGHDWANEHVHEYHGSFPLPTQCRESKLCENQSICVPMPLILSCSVLSHGICFRTHPNGACLSSVGKVIFRVLWSQRNRNYTTKKKTSVIGFHSSSPTKYSAKQYPDIKLFLHLIEGIIPLLLTLGLKASGDAILWV